MVATEKCVYVLYSNKTIEVLNAENISDVVNKTEKLVGLGEKKGEATCFALSEANN